MAVLHSCQKVLLMHSLRCELSLQIHLQAAHMSACHTMAMQHKAGGLLALAYNQAAPPTRAELEQRLAGKDASR
jgi:hypothetical protein